MTIEIDKERKSRAINPPGPAEKEASGAPARLVTGIWCFGIAATLVGLALVGLDLVTERGLHYAVYAAACFVLAGLTGGLIVLRAMLADCGEFYRRGQLDGWMRGWRGQEPESDDPLLR